MRRAAIGKEGVPDVKVLLAVEPDRKIPRYGRMIIASATKAVHELVVSTRRGHQTADGHWGTRRVPTSPAADVCLRSRGTRYGGRKSQLISCDQATVNASTASYPGFWYLLQNPLAFLVVGSYEPTQRYNYHNELQQTFPYLSSV